MFSKLHPHQQQQHHHQQQQPFQFSRECQKSEDDDSRSSGGPNAVVAQTPVLGGGSSDGATIEVVRRPRGRPPGSKNKPKPPLIITREPEPAMSPFILEIPGGSDVVEALARFSRRKNTGLCVLTGSGTVANATLRQPSFTPGVATVATVTFHGRFDILSMSATFLLHASPAAIPPSSFAVSLAGPQGQIVGGLVAGRLLAAGTVFVIASSFNNPSYHRLSSSSDAQNNSGGCDAQSPPVSGGGAESGHVPAESCMYSCHLPSDVIWAPTPRPPF